MGDDPKESNTYSVSADNAHMWGRCLLRCLQMLEANLPVIRVQGERGAATVPQPPLDLEDIREAMIILNAFLRADLLYALIPETLERHLKAQYNEKQKTSATTAQDNNNIWPGRTPS